MEYDVFISCKSEDYEFAEEIYDFLTLNGIKAFLASKELRKIGNTEYHRIIVDAINATSHMIVVASNAVYVDSEWVHYEWSIFVNTLLNGKKQGQIMTILKNVNVKEINIALQIYESFTFEDYKYRLLSYVERKKEICEEGDKKESGEKEKVQKHYEYSILVRSTEPWRVKYKYGIHGADNSFMVKKNHRIPVNRNFNKGIIYISSYKQDEPDCVINDEVYINMVIPPNVEKGYRIPDEIYGNKTIIWLDSQEARRRELKKAKFDEMSLLQHKPTFYLQKIEDILNNKN